MTSGYKWTDELDSTDPTNIDLNINARQLWFGRAAMAKILDMSVSAFDANITPLLESRFKRLEGRKLLFYSPACVRILGDVEAKAGNGRRQRACGHCGR